jgi:hypothetical protein
MADYTIQELFGSGATQNSTSITIQKADLTSLTPSVSNTAESILVALLVDIWLGILTLENYNADIDHQIYISSAAAFFQNRGTPAVRYLLDNFTFTFAEENPAVPLDPDNF